MAQTYYSQCLQIIREVKSFMVKVESWDDSEPYLAAYLGSFMCLDSCGKYHHIISPNGVTDKCIAFWDALDQAAERLDGWIESGEGDPTDIYFCRCL